MVDMDNISRIADPRVRNALLQLAEMVNKSAAKPKFTRVEPKAPAKKKSAKKVK